MKNPITNSASLFFALFGLGLIIVGIAVPIPQQYVQVKDPGLALAVLGFIVSLVGLLMPAFWSFSRKIERSLSMEVTDSSNKNWRAAIKMCKDVADGWTLLDTSTSLNDRGFERAVQDVVSRYPTIEYYRIMSFPEDDKLSLIENMGDAIKSFFLSQIDYEHDGTSGGGRAYDWLRKAITRENFFLLHLPFSLAMDYFVVTSGEFQKCIIGFAESPHIVKAGLSYSNGIISSRADLTAALEDHFRSVLLPAAKRHMREQIKRSSCICSRYCNPEHPGTLWPRTQSKETP